MNTDVKILNQKLANQIPKCRKRIIHHNQVRIASYMEAWLKILKSINITLHISRLIKEEKL